MARKREDYKLILLISLMYVDYFLTYIGIHYYKVIQEGNPFMVELMELPLVPGLLVRTFWILVFTYLFKSLGRREKEGGNITNISLNISILINLYIINLHTQWLAIL